MLDIHPEIYLGSGVFAIRLVAKWLSTHLLMTDLSVHYIYSHLAVPSSNVLFLLFLSGAKKFPWVKFLGGEMTEMG